MNRELRVKLLADASNFDKNMRTSLMLLQNLGDLSRTGGKYTKEQSKAILDCIRSMGSMSTSATTTKGSLKQLNTVLNEMTILYSRLSTKTKGSVVGRAMAEQIDVLRGRVAKLNTQLKVLDTGGTGAGSKYGAFGAIFKGNLAARAAMDGIRMLTGAIKNAIQTNMAFEQANANLAAVLGKTRGEISALTDNAKILGATTVYTAGQITELQTVLARRGFSEGQILQMTKGISSLATATQTDLATSAEIAGSTMQAFGLNASQMDDIVATLGVSTTKSALSMEKLKTSLAYVAPAAKAAGFTLEDTVAMLGTLADAGLPATTAGVAVRNILVHLSTESSKLSKAIGHPVRSLDEFVDAMNELKNKGGNNLEYISSLVEKRVIPGFSVFMSNADKLKELRGEITGVRNELQGMVDEQINTLQGSVTLMKSAWDGLMLSFSSSNGVLKKVTDKLTKMISAFTRASNIANGGNDAVNAYRISQEEVEKRAKAYAYRFNGMESDKVVDILTKDITGYRGKKNNITSAYENYRHSIDSGADWKTKQNARTALETALGIKLQGKNEANEYYKAIAMWEDKIAVAQQIITNISPEEVVSQITEGLEPNKDGSTKAEKKTPAEKAQEHVASALEKYWETVEIAGQRLKSGLDTEEQYNKKMVSAEEALYSAYAKASYDVGGTNEEYKQGMKDCVAAINGYGRVISENEQLEKQRKDQLAAQTRLDNKILKGVMNGISPAGSKINGDEEDLMSYFGLSGIATKIADGTDISEADWTKLEDEINKKLQELKIAPIQIDLETGKVFRMNNEAKEMSKAWQQASSAVNTVGSALASLDNPMAKVAGTIAQAIANVALGAGKAISAKDTTASGWAWIGAAATITAEMIGTIAAIKSAVEYHADGGFVGASSLRRGTDTVPAMLTPGELVLSASQQSNLSRQLSQGGLGNLHLEKVIGAEEIRLILTNNNRRRRRAGTMSI